MRDAAVRRSSTSGGPTRSVDLGVQQIAAWFGIACIVVVMVLGTSRGVSSAQLDDLTGPWSAEVLSPGPWRGTLEVPGLFASQGVPLGARVRYERIVDLPDDGVPRAIWIEHPQYAVNIWWDGVLLGGQGDPASPNVHQRVDGGAMADLPVVGGRHDLVLDVRGDGRKGGIVGRVLVGPRPAIRATWLRADAEAVGLALMLGMLGVLHLRVATRAPKRTAYLFFGLLTSALSVWSFTRSGLSALAIPDFVVHVRLARAANALVPGFGMAFVSAFLYDRVLRGPLWMMLVGGLAVVASIASPFGWLYLVEELVDAATVVALVWFFAATIGAVATRRRWAFALLLGTAPPLVVGTVAHMAMMQGLLGGSSWLFPGLAWFCGGCSIALAVRHADEAARHEQLVAASVDAIVAVDREGRIGDANPAARALFEHPIGTPIERWVRPEDRPLARAHLGRGRKLLDRTELRLVLGPRREVIMDSIASPLDSGTALVVLRDVTVRRKMDHGMLQAARMEMMGAVAGGIAHDFNNMLGTLLAQVGLLQSTVAGPELATLGRMERTIERASVLVRRLLTAAGGTSSDLEPVPLGSICRDAADLVQPALPKGVRLVVDVPEAPLIAMGSEPDLEQVVVNLLMNARDSVGAAGTITVRARPYRVGAVSGVAIVVEDDGPGIPESARTEIFEPFVTTKPAGKGTGLGLAVCAKVVRDHDGRIWVEERPGGGARFVIALRAAGHRDEGGLPDGRNVIVVEDEGPLRDTYANALSGAGYDVRAYASGAAAIEALRERVPDILVTDVVMPDVSGVEVALACQRLDPDVPVLLVSGFMPDEAIEALQAGAWFRLDKPVRVSRLVATVGRLRRRAERRLRGESEITDIRQAMPSLAGLTGADIAS